MIIYKPVSKKPRAVHLFEWQVGNASDLNETEDDEQQ